MLSQVHSLLGLAQRAGKVISGEESVENALRRGKVKLLILAEDASANTSKLFHNLTNTAGVPLHVHGTKLELGLAIGKSHRSAIAITDMNFVRGIKSHLLGITNTNS
jgi:ribosomal protein L7Ae-like RNA K-turn-binding protein